jgi:nitrous oxide reductase accessory protein NosL
MKKFKLFFLLLLSLGLFFSGCEKKKIGEPVKIHWDRDVCERCNMIISDRRFAFEIINPNSGKVHKFDDMGCGIMWLKENKVNWKNKAIMWIVDAKDGKWINAKKAYYTTDNITPMAYGLAGYTKATMPKGKKVIDFKEAIKHVFKINKLEEEKDKI